MFLSGLLTATVTALAAPSWPTGLAITDFYIILLDSGQVGTCGPIFSHKVRTTVFWELQCFELHTVNDEGILQDLRFANNFQKKVV